MELTGGNDGREPHASRLGTSEPLPRILSDIWEETCMTPKSWPTVGTLPATNPEPDTPSEPCPLLSHPWIMPQHWQIEPDIPLGPKPNPRLGFQSSVPRGLAPSLQTGATPQDSACHPGGNCAIWSLAELSARKKLACPLKTTHLQWTLWPQTRSLLHHLTPAFH